MSKIQYFLVSVSLLVASQAANGNVFTQLSISAGTESNVPRGLDAAHEIDSEFLQVGFNGGKFFQLGLYDSVTLSSSINLNRYNNTSGFDSYSLGVQSVYAHKFGFGAYAPRLEFSLGAQQVFAEGRARDVRSSSAQLSLSKRFTPAFSMSVGVDYGDNDSPDLADDAATLSFGYDPNLRLSFELFSYHSKAAFIQGEYAFANGWLLEGRARRIDGGTVSSTTTPSLDLYKVARAFHSDPGFDSGWFAYLLDADTNEWSGGLSIPIDNDSSVNLRSTWHDSKSSLEGSYKNNIFSVGYVRNF